MDRKRIVHITQAHGGVKTYIENILEHSNPDSFEFILIASHQIEFEKFCEERSIKYHVVDLQRSINPVRDFLVLIKIISIIKRAKPDLIHSHSAKGGFLGRIAAKMCGTKVIYTPNALSYLSFTGVKRVIFYLLEYIAKNWTDMFLAVSYSEANRAYFELGFKRDKVSIFLNSIKVDDNPVKDYEKNFRIRMIGRLTYQKNPLLFFEIAKRLLKNYPNLQFSILGAGVHDHLNEEINQFLISNELLNKIEIVKWGDNNTSNNFLNNTDIFVLTSAFEGLPFSLLEAMGKGIPCVVSKADGNSDVIQNNENGFACLSIEEFCDQIDLLINNKEMRRKIGQAGFCYLKNKHDITSNICQVERIYNTLANA